MVLIKRSVETPRSPSIAARSLAWPTLGRPCRRADLEEALNQRCQVSKDTHRILKGASHEEVVNNETDEAMVETNNDEANKIMLILNVWSVETSRYPAWLQRVWQRHSRHADLKKVSSQKSPSTQKYLAGPLGAHPIGRPSLST
jgi:hypothetical protein